MSSEAWVTFVAEVVAPITNTRNTSDNLGDGIPFTDKTYVYESSPGGVRTKFTVANGMIPSTQSNFVALVTGCDDRFRTAAKGGRVQNSSGFDLRPYSDEALTTTLKYELVDYTSGTGCFQMWILFPSIQNGTSFWMRYDDASISTDGTDKASTWAGYLFVYHHEQASGATAPDSSGNANDATVSAGSPTSIAAKIENGIDFGGTSWFTTPRSIFGTNSSLTWQAWCNPHVTTGAFCVGKQDFTTPFDYDFNIYFDGNTPRHIRTDVYNAGGTRVTAGNDGTTYQNYAADTWYFVKGVYNGTDAREYVNGALEGTAASQTGNVRDTVGATINQGVITSSAGSNIKIDEFRIKKNVADSADETLAEYNNQVSPTTFWTMGAEGVTYARRDAQHVTWDNVLMADIATAIKMSGGTNYPRSAVEQVVGAEIAARIFGAVRPNADVAPAAESAVRIYGAVRPTTEGGFTSDKVTNRTYGAVRPLTDTLAAFEYFSNRRFTGARTGADPVAVAENFTTRALGAIRSATEGGTTADKVTNRTFNAVRPVTDSLAAFDYGVRAAGSTRSVAEGGFTFESRLRTFNAVRPVTEGGITSETPLRVFNAIRALAEGGFTREFGVRALTMARTGADAGTAYEYIARVASNVRFSSEGGITLEYNSQRLFSGSRAGSDSTGTSENGRRLLTMARTAAETGLVNEYSVRVASNVRVAFEGSIFNEYVSQRSFSGTRLAVEGGFISDIATRQVNAGRTDYTRIGGDASANFEFATRSLTLARTTADSSVVADNGVRALTMARISADMFSVSDLAARAAGSTRSGVEGGSTADSGRRVFSGFRTTVEVVPASDAGVRAQSSFRSAADSSGISDFATRSKGAVRFATDSAVLFDSSTRSFAGSRSAVESIVLMDNGSRSVGLHRSSIDLFSLSDISTRTVNMVRHYTEDMADAISVFESPKANRIAWNPSLAHVFDVPPRITQWIFAPRSTMFIMTPRVMEWDLSQRQTVFRLSPRVTQFIYQR